MVSNILYYFCILYELFFANIVCKSVYIYEWLRVLNVVEKAMTQCTTPTCYRGHLIFLFARRGLVVLYSRQHLYMLCVKRPP